MKITNNHNLPEAIVQAVSSDERIPKENYISATRLIDSPLQQQLLLKHYKDITADASGMLWSLLGRSVHFILETADEAREDTNYITEQRWDEEVDGWTVSGMSDVYNNGVIEDWKVTSVWSFLNGVKPEWEKQLNVYAWLWRKKGYKVHGLKINAILRDHQAGKAKSSPDYPDIPFISIDVPLWSEDTQLRYIAQRVAVHKLPAQECTPEEKWQKETVYAVMKVGKKSAVKLYNTKPEADSHIIRDPKPGPLYIETREGSCVKCEGYCSVKEFCVYSEGK